MAQSKVEFTDLKEDLANAAKKTLDFFIKNLQENGAYKAPYDDQILKDISAYYKSVLMFILADEHKKAIDILKFISEHFMRKDGDFLSDKKENLKSANGAYEEFWAYTNGWIVRAANLLGNKEVADKGYGFLQNNFYNFREGYFYTNKPGTNNGVSDVLTNAHLGLINLEHGEKEIAKKAGDYLIKMLEMQPDLDKGFYLRSQYGSLMEKQDPLHFIDRHQSNQLYFMIGYPIAYLGRLYKATKEEAYLTAAEQYAKFALSCEELPQSIYSHKVAWAYSILFEITRNQDYLKGLEDISNFFLKLVDKQLGAWFLNTAETDLNIIYNAYDQSAEIACWFMEINKNLGKVEQKSLNASFNANVAMWSSPPSSPKILQKSGSNEEEKSETQVMKHS